MITPVMPTYGRFDITLERGEGAYLYADDGRRFLDFTAGIAVNILGHGHPHLVKALTDQAQSLWHCSNLYHIPQQQRLAQRLVDHSFADTVFFCNSGAEALEGAIKTARKYQTAIGANDRYRVITFEKAFHGRTLATLAAGGQAKHLDGFEPMVTGFDQVPFGNLNAVRGAISGETAAILVEPVQGEGGINEANADFLRALRRTADEFGLLLIFDEVQCGMGRTGALFAHEIAGVAPDIMTLAKGLGGGFPVGALLATAAAAQGMTPGTHGSTFGGNPLACAVANAVLDVITGTGFLAQVNARASQLGDGVRTIAERYPGIIENIRGVGLMLGMKAGIANTDFVAALQANGLLCVGAGDNVVRLLPPLNITEDHVRDAVAIIEKTCAELAG